MVNISTPEMENIPTEVENSTTPEVVNLSSPEMDILTDVDNNSYNGVTPEVEWHCVKGK